MALRDSWQVVAPDLRGHGDSDWSPDRRYSSLDYVSDRAALVEQAGWARMSIIAHSVGGKIVLRYAGLFRDRVIRLIAIEGVDMRPTAVAADIHRPIDQLWREWIERKILQPARKPDRYRDRKTAATHLKDANPHLGEEMGRHLTLHGTRSDDTGGFVWKFDNMVRFPNPSN